MTDEVLTEKRGPGRPPRVRLPDDAVPQPRRPESEWLPMDEAPTDGKIILLRSPENDDGKRVEVLGLLRNARRFDAQAGKWTPVEFWVEANSGGLRLPWEPEGWRPRMGIL